ncbi:MAG: site-specific integrase, partial [Clostridia bacterium]|nr:site-specific integrase [Clostridia bacterium]
RSATYYKQDFVLGKVKTKNSKRTLLLADSLYEILQEHKAEQEKQAEYFGEGFNPYNLIIFRANGTPLTSSMLQNGFKRALQEAGLPNIRFHDLRHTNATLLLKQGVQIKTISSMLGHSSIGITLDTYSHVTFDMQKQATNIVENLLSENEY